MATLDLKPGYTGIATHALIIGVGAYRHLEGGPQPAGEAWGLGQLPGAEISANQFLIWLRDRYHNPTAPLATIEHLITGPPGTTLGSEEPTMAAVEAAFDRWFARCSTNAENIALFYFAGHGLLKGSETGLLTADFAQPGTANLVRRAINVEETVFGSLSCRSDKQCFIIDACRTTEEPLLGVMTRPGSALATASEADARPLDQAVIFASGLNQTAYQRGNVISPFTKALIESLEGMGVDDISGGYAPGECVVDTSSLVKGIRAAMMLERREQPFLKAQDATMDGGGNFAIHHPRESIKVPLIVGCTPPNLNLEAELHVRQNGSPVVSQAAMETDLVAVVPVVTDSYEAVGKLSSGAVASKRCLVTPPYREVRLSNFANATPGPL